MRSRGRWRVLHVERTAESRFVARRIAALSVMAIALVGGVGTASAQQMTLPGSFAVNSNGAATYDIAIAVPPGIAGMVPSLKLSYSSQNGNGILGVGWMLSGLPSVARCAQTVAQDGARGSVKFDANDRFCMDGQRLIAINGSYGADGTEYRTEIDSYSRIISHGTTGTGPTWFQVYTKSGQIMEFGNTTDSLIPAGNGSARNWALNKVSDTTGNYFTVTYTNNNIFAAAATVTNGANTIQTGEAYPSRIDYTGTAANGRSPFNSVQFFYETRPDIISVYQAGIVAQTTVRLTDIKTYAQGVTGFVSDYNIAYQLSPATQASEIASIKVCAGDGSCLPATTVNWLTSSTAAGTFAESSVSPFSTDTFGSPNPSGAAPYLLNGDFNGDGKTDFAFAKATTLWTFLSNGNGTFAQQPTNTNAFNGACIGVETAGGPICPNSYSMSGDFNGDGLTDLAFIGTTTRIGGTILVLMSNGNGTFSPLQQQQIALSVGSPTSGNYFTSSGDFNGDGRTDIVFISGASLSLYISNGDGTFSESTNTNAFAPTNFNAPSQGSFYFMPGDFNGDGKSDLSFWRNQQGWVYVSIDGNTPCVTRVTSGSTTFCQTVNSLRAAGVGTPTTNPGTPVVGDFNGDGKTDIGFAGGGRLYTLISVGNGFFVEHYSVNSFPGYPVSATGLPYVIPGDFNADGKTDFSFLLGATPGGTCDDSTPSQDWTFLNKGDGSFQPVKFACFSGSFQYQGASFYLTTGDFDGDGKTDFAFIQGTTLWVFLANGPPADLIGSIQTGLLSTTSITYQPLTNSSIYARDNDGAIYPLQNIQAPLYVVTGVDAPNGIGGNYSSIYSYNGAKVDLSGRGFLGFHQMYAYDLQTSLLRTTTYQVSFPTLGVSAFPCLGLTQSVVKSIGAQALNATSNGYTYTNSANPPQSQSCGVSGGTTVGTPSNANAPYQVSVAATYAQSWDLDGTAIPTSTTTYQYDSYGNPTQIVTSTPDGFRKITTNTYTNDTTAPHWLLGRLTNATVSSTTP
jgi:hypothetical protein